VRRALPLALLALAAAPAGAQAAERVVDMPAKYFVPPNITMLAGDTVTWTNSDTIEHDVASVGVGFDSGVIGPGGRYSQTFSQPGHYAYRCTIHAFMAGTVDVYSFQLLGPDHPIPIGHPAILRGIAPSGTSVVRIESRAPAGTAWAPVTAVAPAPDGSFRAQVRPAAPTVYRAVTDAGPSLPLPLKVGARLATTVKRLKHGRYAIRATAQPAQPGALAALQLYSRERFRWRQVEHARIGRDSRVTFKFHPPGRYAARVVILRGKAGYGASVGPTRHIGGHAKKRRPAATMAPPRMHHPM
jgi:plastocyanin